jgi:hypothetical protein
MHNKNKNFIVHKGQSHYSDMKNPAQTGSGCIRFNELNFHKATFAE